MTDDFPRHGDVARGDGPDGTREHPVHQGHDDTAPIPPVGAGAPPPYAGNGQPDPYAAPRPGDPTPGAPPWSSTPVDTLGHPVPEQEPRRGSRVGAAVLASALLLGAEEGLRVRPATTPSTTTPR